MAIQFSCTRYSSLPTETVLDTYQLLYLWFVHHKRSYFIAGAISRPTGQSLDQFNAQLFQLLNVIHIGNKEVYVIGDFSIDLLKPLLISLILLHLAASYPLLGYPSNSYYHFYIFPH